jgi:hypothetical protein
MRGILRILALIILTLSFVSPAAADTITYTFTGTGFNSASGFSFTTSGFITTSTTITASQMTYCSLQFGNPCTSVTFFPQSVGGFYDTLSPFGSNATFFQAGAVGAVGTYQPLPIPRSQPGVLTVTQSTETPEPASLALFASGILGTGALQRRFRA